MSILTYNGFQISQRDTDGYVNATQMAQANNKRVNDWLRSQETTVYIDEISSVTGIPVTELVVIKQGGSPENQGTWILKCLLHLASRLGEDWNMSRSTL